MPSFSASEFAIAGLIAAAGPIVIHLLNRRRFHVLDWAAMDFLREAIQRNRRILQIRDLILLLLRIFCMALIGLALARPFFSTVAAQGGFRNTWPWVVTVIALGTALWAVLSGSRATKIAAGLGCLLATALAGWGMMGIVQSSGDGAEGALSSRQPVHAVLLIDNSLSMGYESLQGTLLDRSKTKAREFIDELPAESRTTIIPICGSELAYSLDAYRTKDDAKDALDRIQIVSRSASTAEAIDLAAEACRQVPELQAKRVVLLSDQQLRNWPAESLKASLEKIPELQVVQIAAEEPSNVWVSDIRVQDNIADVETVTTFYATLRYEGSAKLDNVQVTLSIDGEDVASRTVELMPGQERQEQFRYRVDVPTEPSQPSYVSVGVRVETESVSGDGLKSDNTRHLVVPVVSGLPVVFVDQYGSEEDFDKGLIGETLPLRGLMAQRMARDDTRRPLVRVRHKTLAELDIETLEDVRLVVIAGVESPGDEKTVRLLREYVQQGGNLVILAGAEFDPIAWNTLAWKEGNGILPAPLKLSLLGYTLRESAETGEYREFRLAFESMQHDYFLLEGESLKVLKARYEEDALFMKIAEVDAGPPAIKKLLATETERLTEQRKFLKESTKRQADWARMKREGTFGDVEKFASRADEERQKQLQPDWLTWHREESVVTSVLSIDALARRTQPQVVASFAQKKLPYIVERTIGSGQTLFIASGVRSAWNTLAIDDRRPFFIYDRIFRALLERTLPPRNFDVGESIRLAVDKGERLRHTLSRPNSQTEEVLSVEAFGSEAYGVTIRNPLRSGPYVLTVRQSAAENKIGPGETLNVIPLAINGPADESELVAIQEVGLQKRLGDSNYKWIERNESISLEGAAIRGRDSWRLLIMLALICLLVEMIVLAWPALHRSAKQEPAT
jgi:hypothetical protein